MNKGQGNEENEHVKAEVEPAEVASNSAAEKQVPDTDEAGDEQTSEMTKLKEEVASAKDKYLRLYSEFENFRRRTSKEKLELIQSANEQLIKSLLPVLDDFERAEKVLDDKINMPELEGMLLIHQKLKKILEAHGVKPVDIPEKSEFNTDLHEAVSQVPGDETMKGKIVDVLEKGYTLNDKVIRFAKVVVGG